MQNAPGLVPACNSVYELLLMMLRQTRAFNRSLKLLENLKACCVTALPFRLFEALGGYVAEEGCAQR